MIDTLAIDTAATAPTPAQDVLRIIARYARNAAPVTLESELVDAVPNVFDRAYSIRAALEEHFGDVPDARFNAWATVRDVVDWVEGGA